MSVTSPLLASVLIIGHEDGVKSAAVASNVAIGKLLRRLVLAVTAFVHDTRGLRSNEGGLVHHDYFGLRSFRSGSCFDDWQSLCHGGFLDLFLWVFL